MGITILCLAAVWVLQSHGQSPGSASEPGKGSPSIPKQGRPKPQVGGKKEKGGLEGIHPIP